MPASLDNPKPIDVRPIKRALISVYDKTGLEDFARALGGAGVKIVSTGSMAARIAAADMAVAPVDDVTGLPEVLEGRVKTLHPFIHSGILADQRKVMHREQIAQLDIQAFDLVVYNLYPFQDTATSGAFFDECAEQIDISGPSMVRVAAKNYPSVAVVTSPEHYADVAEAVAGESFALERRRVLAAEALAHTATYDLTITGWPADELDLEDVHETLDDATETHPDASDAALLGSLGYQTEEDYVVEAPEEEGQASSMPVSVADAFERVESLRYDENPHQGVTVYYEIDESFEDEEADDEAWALGIVNARQLHGKVMSHNNYTNGDAALHAAYDHERPCVAIIKRANPYGVAVVDGVAEVHRLAHACDPVSASGGMIVVNRPASVELARQIVPIFTEVVLASDYEKGTLEVLSTKKNLCVLQIEPPTRGSYEFKQISGGLLIQERDDTDAPGDSPENWTFVADTPADEATLAGLEFAWCTVRVVRSNAVLLVRDGVSVGVGMGQVNRVDSCKLMAERVNTLGSRSTGDAAASNVDSVGGARVSGTVDDAPERCSIGVVAVSGVFFPSADGLQVLIDAGVEAVIQPGSPVRDQGSIGVANAAGVMMYLTGTCHFAYRSLPFMGSKGQTSVWCSFPEICACMLGRGVVFSILFNC